MLGRRSSFRHGLIATPTTLSAWRLRDSKKSSVTKNLANFLAHVGDLATVGNAFARGEGGPVGRPIRDRERWKLASWWVEALRVADWGGSERRMDEARGTRSPMHPSDQEGLRSGIKKGSECFGIGRMRAGLFAGPMHGSLAWPLGYGLTVNVGILI
ncbi:hypothetical protein KM043_007084 [Ampulex compressa]|nr:hypothetical protein KM043_007084 [Ampulex compressa]